MALKSKLKTSYGVLTHFAREPRLNYSLLRRLLSTSRGLKFARQWNNSSLGPSDIGTSDDLLPREANPLKEYFDSHLEGRGIWKWEHYFDIYHRHFSRFRGRTVYVLEIGIFSGGSLDMWKTYFGPKCHVIGVDIQEACKIYEDDRTKILIGDQGDREFWARVKKDVPRLDIVIDDGGHVAEDQIVTMEELLPHLHADGVYLCEDVQSIFNKYSAYVYGIADNLNDIHQVEQEPDAADKKRPIVVKANEFQQDIRSIHLYPFVTVIEKNDRPVEKLIANKHGTHWQPYL